MLVYSKSYQDFLIFLKNTASIILTKEMNISCGRNRFLYNNYYHSFDFVLFEDQNILGFFDHKMKRIGVHKDFRHLKNNIQIKNLLRHELAHYMDSIINGVKKNAHDNSYHQICKKYGWGKDVYSATTNFSFLTASKKKTKLTNKIQKLLSLGLSDNKYEAKLALQKANQLLLENNLKNDIDDIPNLNNIAQDYCEKIYMQNVLEQKRITPKFLAINKILPFYFIKTVINKPKGSVYIEVIGKKCNVEISAYIANFLDFELEKLWLKEKNNLDKIYHYSKKSFMEGIAIGFIQQIEQNQNYLKHTKEILTINNSLNLALTSIYPRLSSTKLQGSKTDLQSKNVGEILGKLLKIKKSVCQSSSKFIGFSNS